MNLSRVTLILALFVAVLLTACGSGGGVRNTVAYGQNLPAPDTSTASGLYQGGTDYRIGAQDLLEISVFGIDELNKSVRVNSNGQISLPLIGGVMAGGQTIPALEKTIAGKLAEGYLQHPEVSVFVKEFTSQRITLEGEVKKPGIYRITGKITLLQAIATGEGLTDLADTGGVVLFREVNGKRMAAAFDLSTIRSGQSPDPQVYGDDVIVVEKSGSKSALRQLLMVLPAIGLFKAL
ncbi:MAG: polysaccharide biosynthesis/export family protein [Luteimonas sp.]